MQLPFAWMDLAATRSIGWLAVLSATAASTTALAKPHVEFDFARAAECRDVTPTERARRYPQQRLIEVVLPVSVRFHGVAMEDVEELDIEISGSAAGLHVFDFSPDTQLASDVERTIETTTTVKKARSLDGTLGGQLPVPYAEVIAHVTPSINAGISRGETATEKLQSLAAEVRGGRQWHVVRGAGRVLQAEAVVANFARRRSRICGDSSSRRPIGGAESCSSAAVRGAARKMLWLDQEATLGRAGSEVQLYVAGRSVPREPVRHVVAKQPSPTPTTSRGPTTVKAAPAFDPNADKKVNGVAAVNAE